MNKTLAKPRVSTVFHNILMVKLCPLWPTSWLEELIVTLSMKWTWNSRTALALFSEAQACAATGFKSPGLVSLPSQYNTRQPLLSTSRVVPLHWLLPSCIWIVYISLSLLLGLLGFHLTSSQALLHQIPVKAQVLRAAHAVHSDLKLELLWFLTPFFLGVSIPTILLWEICCQDFPWARIIFFSPFFFLTFLFSFPPHPSLLLLFPNY